VRLHLHDLLIFLGANRKSIAKKIKYRATQERLHFHDWGHSSRRVRYKIGKFEEGPQFHPTKVILLQGRLENSISNKLIPFQAAKLDR
jgi:hypothetical protein